MVDVSAQGSCTITPLNPTTLTATGGALPNGTMNVMIQCNCTNNDGTVVDRVKWYDPDGIRLVADRHNRFNASVPHITRVNGSDTHVILVIPTLNDSYDGTYTCGKKVKKGLLPGPPNGTVDLTIEGELMIGTISNLCSSKTLSFYDNYGNIYMHYRLLLESFFHIINSYRLYMII